jgi:hypothetical protein
MRTTVQIPDPLFDELMAITNAESRTAAVLTAIEQFVRRSRLDRLRKLRGKLDIVGIELSDQADFEEQRERVRR